MIQEGLFFWGGSPNWMLTVYFWPNPAVGLVLDSTAGTDPKPTSNSVAAQTAFFAATGLHSSHVTNLCWANYKY